ncbi:unnamed protein product [Adineta ricciae]|nr:unnamed protein product [Adineta ricciae]
MTMTTITFASGKRRFSASHLKKRHTVPILTNDNLPDLLSDIYLERRQRQDTIVNIAKSLRKVGDQLDEQLQIRSSSSSDCIFGQGTIVFLTCLSHVLRLFL